MNNCFIKQVKVFNCLRFDVSYRPNLSYVLEKKISKFQYMCDTLLRTLNKIKVWTDVLLKFDREIIVPTHSYGNEVWTLTKSDCKRVQIGKIKFSCPMAGYTLRDCKKNSDIREELSIFPINKLISHRMGKSFKCRQTNYNIAKDAW